MSGFIVLKQHYFDLTEILKNKTVTCSNEIDISLLAIIIVSRDSAVSIGTGYRLDGRGSEFQAR
jgi:hypothetical protein